MNCDEFAGRMQDRLDERLPLETDWRLQRHAKVCPNCRSQLQAWQRVATVVNPSADQKSRSRQALWGVMGLAAALLLMSVLRQQSTDSRPPVAPHAVAQVGEGADAAGMDPQIWWRDVQDRDWIAQTMPAVRSLREGVAPLGRSLLQAVTILTTGSGEQPT